MPDYSAERRGKRGARAHGNAVRTDSVVCGITTPKNAALDTYLKHRRGDWGGTRPLIRGTSVVNDGLAFSPDAVRSLFKRLAARAEITLPAGAPVHSLRHAYAHTGLDAGIDGLHVQQLLGHTDIATTQRYTREHPDQLKRIYDRYYQRKRP